MVRQLMSIVLLTLAAANVHAQQFPVKPIRLILPFPTGSGFVMNTGKLRVIAVLGTQRAADLPDVPTAIEQGMPELVAVNYYGLLAPAGTPPDVIERLNREITRVVRSPEAKKAFARADLDLVNSTAPEFADFIRKDSAKWSKVVRAAKLQLE